jgi:RNA polymerase sigma-54 factor
MALEQKLNLRLSQRLVMTPSLQQAIKLLQMSRLELQEVLTQEMVENPILEDQEETETAERTETTPETEEPAPPADAATPAEEKDRDSFDEIDFDSYFSDYLDSAYNPRQYQEEPEEYSLENVLTRPEGLPEHLTWQLSMSEAPPSVREIAAYLIGNIDEDGYLRVSREEVRAEHPETEADVESALELVRSFDPPGVCAFDLPDCLMLQLKTLGIENALIETIILKHWPEFLNRQFAALSKTLNVGISEVQAAVEIIKNLEPKPGRKYSSERTIYVEPDVFVRKIGDEYVIQLSEDGLPKLRISARTAGFCGAATARSGPRRRTTCARRCARPSGSSRASTSASGRSTRSPTRSSGTNARSWITASSTCGRSSCGSWRTTSACTSRPSPASCRTSTSTRRAGSFP